MSDLAVVDDDSATTISTDMSSTTPAASLSNPSSKLISNRAEEELLDLAQNFLLYVAMVIIVVMVTRIYWPHLLKRGRADDSAFGSGAGGRNQVGVEEDSNLTELVEKKNRRSSRRRQSDRAQQVSDALSFNQESTEKDVVLKRLLLCFFGLNFSFVCWGILQERMLTRRYPRYTGEFFGYSYFLVFSNRLWGLIMSGILMIWLKPKRSKGVLIWEYSFPSISNMLSSWCQYEALKYVTFPAQTLFKSFKLAPIMLMGKLLQNKEYPFYDYAVAVVVGSGIALFMSGSENVDFSVSILSYGQQESNTSTGIMMLFLFLFFDSFTGQWQSRMFNKNPDLTVVELLFATSAFSTVLSLITLVHADELGPALDFVWRHNEIHLHFFLFSVCSTVGQLLIFYTIKNFGAVVFAIIMATRVLISIVVSCLLYDHPMTATGFAGLLLVMCGVGYRVKMKAEGKQLIRWKGIEDEEEEEDMVHEWHEHLDM